MKKIRKMSPPFLSELVIDILLRLPVSSLLRLRCLSRSLCTEIDSESFVKNHLNRSIQTKARQKLIFYDPISMGPDDLYFAAFDDDLVDAFLLKKPFISHFGGASLFGSCDGGASLFGSCNGLILLGKVVKYPGLTMDLAVWNPFTRRYKKLPLCPVQTLPKHGGFVSSGLGYDSAHDDYKVVMISMVHDSNREFFQVWVFSLKSDFWRRSRDLEDGVATMVGHFANGALYWLCRNKCVGFDLANEVFFDIPQLSDYSPAAFFLSSLVVFGGNLYFGTLHDETVDFYLLVNDVSDKGREAVVSWRKEFTIENVKNIFPYVFQLWPLAYSKDGDSILLGDVNGVFRHNLENKTNQRVNIAGVPEHLVYRYNVCLESLVSVGTDSAVDGAA